MIVKTLELDNFRKFIGNTAFVFTPKTKVCGQNKSGKSTLKSAILWIFNSKDEKGKEIGGLRPHDEVGNMAITEKDNVSVTLVVEKDGTEITLTKIQKQTKSGGTSTDCKIKGYDVGIKEYERQIRELIPSEVCLNAQTFINLPTKEARALLFNCFGEISYNQVLDIYSEFEELREEFKSAQEVYDKLQEKKKETTTLSTIIINKYKGNIKDLESQRTEVIYNLTKAKETAGVDIAERELHLNALSEQINDNKAKQTNIDKSLADMDKLTDGILELKTEESDIIRNANAENIKARGDIENKILEIKHQVAVLESKGIECEHNVSKAQREYSEYSDKLEQQREEYKVLREKEFDDTRSLVCAYCGQEYPQEKKDELRAKFEATKLSELKALSDIGLEYRTIRDNAKESLKVNQEAIAKYQDEITKLDTQCSDLEKQLSEIPTDVDVSDMPRIAQIRSEIAEKDKLIKSMANMQNERTELLNALLGLQSEYDMERIKIEQAQQAQNDVDSLTDRQRELSQQIADNERMKDLVEQFDRAKCKLAEDKINSNFEVIKFKLFETQINGEIKDVCRILVDGEDYERNLNHGSRILAEIDLCKAFQKAYNVELPIMVDDLECLDTWRIPDIPNQLIGFMRTDDKELIVGEF